MFFQLTSKKMLFTCPAFAKYCRPTRGSVTFTPPRSLLFYFFFCAPFLKIRVRDDVPWCPSNLTAWNKRPRTSTTPGKSIAAWLSCALCRFPLCTRAGRRARAPPPASCGLYLSTAARISSSARHRISAHAPSSRGTRERNFTVVAPATAPDSRVRGRDSII